MVILSGTVDTLARIGYARAPHLERFLIVLIGLCDGIWNRCLSPTRRSDNATELLAISVVSQSSWGRRHLISSDQTTHFGRGVDGEGARKRVKSRH